MTHYKQLPPEQKFEVLRRWIDYTIRRGWIKKNGDWIRNPFKMTIENYFRNMCSDMKPGSRQHGLIHARYCWYCGRKFGKDWSSRTVDHFFPRGHKNRKIIKFVICCRSCNHWKDDRSPEGLIRTIAMGEAPEGWGESTSSRIRRILRDTDRGQGPQAYYTRDKIVYSTT